MSTAIDRAAIERVHRIIEPHIRRTPAIDILASDFGLFGAPMTLKLELLQRAGSFKARGAFAHLLTREVPPPASSPHPAGIMAPPSHTPP